MRAARRFFNSGNHEWQLAILDHTLAALVWVKEPTAAPELPRQQIIADCYAASSPSTAMWAQVDATIDRLSTRPEVSADDVALLRHSNEAQRAIMDATLGDPDRVTTKTIEVALTNARAAAAAPAEADRDLAVARADAAETAEATGRFERDEALARASDLELRVEDIESKNTRRAATLIRDTKRTATHAYRSVEVALVLVLALSIIVTAATFMAPFVSSAWSGWLPRWAQVAGVVLVASAVILAAALGGLTVWRGGSIKSWRASQEAKLHSRLAVGRLKRAGWSGEDARETFDQAMREPVPLNSRRSGKPDA